MDKLGVHGAYDAFKMLRAKAFKIDLWRWMALWYYGGIYMDAKMAFTQDVNSWLNFKNDEFVMCAAPHMFTNNGFMAMTQYHPYGLMMTKNIINKVENRYYMNEEYTNLNITGPDAIRSEFIKDHELTWFNLRCYMDLDDKNHKWRIYTADNQNHADKANLVIESDPLNEGNYMKMKSCPTCNNYVKLWDEHSVYCDEPGKAGQSTCDGKDWTQFLETNSWNHDTYGSDNNGKELEIVKTALIARNIEKPKLYFAHQPAKK